jgi:hypothetical protein
MAAAKTIKPMSYGSMPPALSIRRKSAPKRRLSREGKAPKPGNATVSAAAATKRSRQSSGKRQKVLHAVVILLCLKLTNAAQEDETYTFKVKEVTIMILDDYSIIQNSEFNYQEQKILNSKGMCVDQTMTTGTLTINTNGEISFQGEDDQGRDVQFSFDAQTCSPEPLEIPYSDYEEEYISFTEIVDMKLITHLMKNYTEKRREHAQEMLRIAKEALNKPIANNGVQVKHARTRTREANQVLRSIKNRVPPNSCGFSFLMSVADNEEGYELFLKQVNSLFVKHCPKYESIWEGDDRRRLRRRLFLGDHQ